MANCCQQLKAEIAALRNDIATLNDKFSSKSETAYLKQQIKNLQQQLNQLKAEIKSIPRIDEKKLIEKTEAGLIPKLPAILLPLLKVEVNPIKTFQAKQLSNQKQLLDRIFKAESATRTAQRTANTGLQKSGSALAKIASIVIQLAAFGVAIGTLKLVETRFDQQDKTNQALSRDLSKSLGLIGQNRALIKQNDIEINKNKKRINDVNDTAYSAQKQATQARETGEKANTTSKQNLKSINGLNQKIEKNELTTNQALKKAGEANAKAQQASKQASEASLKAQQALREAIKARNKAFLNPGNNTTINNPKSSGDKVTDAQLQQLLRQVQGNGSKLDRIIGLTTPIVPAIGKINNNVSTLPNSTAFKKSVGNATCKSLQGSCTLPLRNDIGRIVRNQNNRLLEKLNLLSSGANNALNNTILNRVNTINQKMGAQLPGGLSGTFGRLWQTLQVDRMLNMLTYITTLHNAMMLSNSIGQTLFSAVDNISQSVGFKWKDEKGSDVGFGSIVSQWTSNFFKGLFGVENYNAMTATYKQANRIYQAGANIINAVRSMLDSVRNISEFIAENTGRIGNALKRYGVIGEDAFKWMPERVDGRSVLLQRLENLEESVSGIEMITGEVLSITQNVNEIQQQAQTFQQSISGSPIKSQTENTAVQTKESAERTQSQSPTIPQSAERNP